MVQSKQLHVNSRDIYTGGDEDPAGNGLPNLSSITTHANGP
jgi:hypothetical protein